MKQSSKKCKFNAKFIFQKRANFVLKHFLEDEISQEKSKCKNLMLQNEIRTLDKNKFRINFSLFR